jgi:hypothetical protein
MFANNMKTVGQTITSINKTSDKASAAIMQGQLNYQKTLAQDIAKATSGFNSFINLGSSIFNKKLDSPSNKI